MGLPPPRERLPLSELNITQRCWVHFETKSHGSWAHTFICVLLLGSWCQEHHHFSLNSARIRYQADRAYEISRTIQTWVCLVALCLVHQFFSNHSQDLAPLIPSLPWPLDWTTWFLCALCGAAVTNKIPGQSSSCYLIPHAWIRKNSWLHLKTQVKDIFMIKVSFGIFWTSEKENPFSFSPLKGVW